MIYMKSDDGSLRILVLETANLEQLKNGRPLRTQDGEVLVAWTPDMVWLADKLMYTGGDASKIAEAIEQSAKRPQKPPRPKHKPHKYKFGGD